MLVRGTYSPTSITGRKRRKYTPFRSLEEKINATKSIHQFTLICTGGS